MIKWWWGWINKKTIFLIWIWNNPPVFLVLKRYYFVKTRFTKLKHKYRKFFIFFWTPVKNCVDGGTAWWEENCFNLSPKLYTQNTLLIISPVAASRFANRIKGFFFLLLRFYLLVPTNKRVFVSCVKQLRPVIRFIILDFSFLSLAILLFFFPLNCFFKIGPRIEKPFWIVSLFFFLSPA